MLMAGSAHAAWSLLPGPDLGYECSANPTQPTSIATCELGVTSLEVVDKKVTLLPGPNGSKWFKDLLADDNFAFSVSGSLWQFDFDPAGVLSASRPSGELYYKLEITDPNQSFASAILTTPPTTVGDFTVTKEFFEDATFTTLIPAWTLTIPPLPDTVAITGKTIYVRDNWTVSNGTQLDSFQNYYSQTGDKVPGPLPLLGAGAAFGFSRQLRKRIRKYTLA